MNLYEHFESIATRHKAIAHSPQSRKFCVLENFEEHTATRQDVSTETPCLFLSINSGQMLDRNADNVQSITNITLFVVQRCDTNDYASIYDTYERTRTIGLNIVGELRRQSAALTLQSFQVPAITFSPIANFPNANDVGYQFNIAIQNQQFEPINDLDVWT